MKELPKPKKEQSKRKNGPFKPTEIPSPIFGFNRPKNTKEIVEHELCHFFSEEPEKELDYLVAFEETIPEIESTAIIVKEDNGPREKSNSFEIAQHREMEATLEVVSAKTSVGVQTATSSISLEEIERESVTKEKSVEASPEPPTPKSSHLPFNVMMLKQDKQKWEERKRKRVMEQQQVLQPELQVLQPELQVLQPELQVQQPELQVPQPELKVQQPLVQEQQQHQRQQVLIMEHKKEKVDLFQNNEEKNQQNDQSGYVLPPFCLLNPPVILQRDDEWLRKQEELLNQTLQNFNVGASVVNVTQGPSVTRFEVQPEPGVKVNKITNLSDDIKLCLAARDIRIEAPIPGKHTIGIEVPNQKSRPVLINEILQSSVFQESLSPLTAVLGLDIAGKPIVTDLKKMPHGLIAGATGSGKSVCINSIIISLLYKASPEDLRLLLIDPKMVELAPYNQIPHLVCPVITDVKAATAALKWAVDEMERRYELFAHTGVRDIHRFNELAIKHKQYSDKLPFIVIIIDELADLMMMSPADVEEAICRIAQKARACGIHLIVATQRPSVDVITGLIKANIPTRIAFSVSSQVDSRTIIDISGAEKLLGRGDMLFLENGSSKPVRLQGTFVSDEEIDLIVDHVKGEREPDYLFVQEELLKKAQIIEDEDELFYDTCEFIIEQGGASTSSLQRRFKIGYNRAARLMDMLETNGYITSSNGSKAREVLMTEADLESIQD
ncbi:MAG: DNA translocase FtsK [Bacillus sp. (in: Bacteria)]|nr:DNA translocase FtsK [Bacillus sp. (in: firmicutes)]